MGEEPRELPLRSGTPVRVRNRFDESFAAGFVIDTTTKQGYRVVRVSDRARLPAVFAPEDVLPER